MAHVALFALFAFLFSASDCSGADRDDNINLLKEEVDKALSVCVENDTQVTTDRQRETSRNINKRYAEKNRVDVYPEALHQRKIRVGRGGASAHGGNPYDHQRRDSFRSGDMQNNDDGNTSMASQNSTPRSFDTNVQSRSVRSSFSRLLNSQGFRSVRDLNFTPGLYYGLARSKRHERLLKKTEQNECLAQCIFTNLQVVDDRAIPQESLLVRAFMTTMLSGVARTRESRRLKSCFEEMTDDDENDGCSFANKLERCLMLGFKERKNIYMMRNI